MGIFSKRRAEDDEPVYIYHPLLYQDGAVLGSDDDGYVVGTDSGVTNWGTDDAVEVEYCPDCGYMYTAGYYCPRCVIGGGR